MKKVCTNKILKIVIILCLAVDVGSLKAEAFLVDSFDDTLKGWMTKAKTFHGWTQYSIVKYEGNSVLKAYSTDSASSLIKKFSLYPADYPILKWRWKVENIIREGKERQKRKDDYAARIYVIFDSGFTPFGKRCIVYAWASTLKQEEVISSPWNSKIMIVAVESGNENVGKWISEIRNVYEDYQNIFGEKPPKIDGIAIMTDTDGTGETVTAYYDDIVFMKK
ncbi:MAG: DUF3047 domain-containing protein [Nitrospinota bacterium]